MNEFRYCQICCTRNNITKHHKFSQTKRNKKLYGHWIDGGANIQFLCLDCHLAKVEGIIIWDEIQFCLALKIVPRSKTGLATWIRLGYDAKST